MTLLTDLHRTLDTMTFAPLLSAFGFLAAYVLAVSDFLGAARRTRVRFSVLLAAALFVALTSPWVHGVLLLALAVGAVGVFIALVMLTSRVLGMSEVRGAAAAAPAPAPAAPDGARPTGARRISRGAAPSRRAGTA